MIPRDPRRWPAAYWLLFGIGCLISINAFVLAWAFGWL